MFYRIAAADEKGDPKNEESINKVYNRDWVDPKGEATPTSEAAPGEIIHAESTEEGVHFYVSHLILNSTFCEKLRTSLICMVSTFQVTIFVFVKKQNVADSPDKRIQDSVKIEDVAESTTTTTPPER